MPELASEERIAALEAALLELHGPRPGPLCRCVNCNDFKPCPGQALSGDNAALKAMLEAARMEGFKDGQEVRDSLRAQLDALRFALSVYRETPAASLAAVREQARREALEKAVALFPITNGVAELWTPQQIRTMLRGLAAQPAKEPQS